MHARAAGDGRQIVAKTRLVLGLTAVLGLSASAATEERIAIPAVTKAPKTKAERTSNSPFVRKGSEHPEFASSRILVRLRPNPQVAARTKNGAGLPGVRSLERLTAAKGQAATNKASRWFVARLEPEITIDEALRAFSRHPDVEYAEPDYLRPLPQPRTSLGSPGLSSDDPRSSGQYALDRIQAADAWAIHAGDPAVIVAVIDSGIELDHPDLANCLWRNSNESINGVDDDNNGYVDDVVGWDFADEDNSPAPSSDHGTHVAGVIGAVRDNTVGIAGIGNLTVMAVKVFGDEGAYNSDIIRAIDYAVANGAGVINMSLGSPVFSQALGDACDSAAAHDVVVVAASGNEGAATPSYPANYASVIAVGATDVWDVPADFSNHGWGLEVVAPGVDILSTITGSDYGFKSGTSMASPHAAAVAALIRSAHRDLDAAAVRGRLAGTADDLGQGDWDETFGYGRINAYRALTESTTRPPPPAPPDDEFEPNDGLEQARAIQPGVYELEGWNPDWFQFDLHTAGEASISIDGPRGDLDLFLLGESGETLAQSISIGSHEVVATDLDPGGYFIVVVPYNGQVSNYTLELDAAGAPSLDDSFEENDEFDDARAIALGWHELICLDEDWFEIELTTPGALSVRIDGPEGDLDLFLFHDSGALLRQSVGSDSHESIVLELGRGNYVVAVNPFEGQGGDYVMEIRTSPRSDDTLEENDDWETAVTIEPGVRQLMCWDTDWFRLELGNPGELTVSVDGPAGDIDLVLFDADMVELAASTALDSHESITVRPPADTCYVAVYPALGQGGSYELNVEFVPDCGAFAPPVMFGTLAGMVGIGSFRRRRRAAGRGAHAPRQAGSR